ncbi:23S rRNA (uracil(1939)-C(5))-methyltransferase RlmD [Vibrio breoganii]|uniref:23S rRNA (uracil(1939)-C(5))-methyltransferase RlmD n=1 Tax=Vibrio breoganii TaxID=553239 RepID=UPI00080E76F9|nr:23S rRNA (uracil(1939)-C(5))-methyltransferase RlmD [Vibrio breoganii]OCH70750.1 23S rRNA (uracil(1939)-C(5))-methyltransferase [Vibrio breoganii]PMG06228.1 23S rRNA (uracil(1939)-C(5))-methyltransferase [Vibrio breoganii]PML30873.1 23S rRNA (uracil(1939)-C(5))-methyltransferase [Vibrio breoganii]
MANFYKPQKNNNRTQKHLSLTIEKYDFQGSGMAYAQGKPVFISGALVGEEVVCQPVESKAKFIKAKLIKVLKASEERVTAFCPHFQQCGGCTLQHMPYEQQLEVKQQAFSKVMSKVAPQQELEAPIVGNSRSYRRRARISLLWDTKKSKLHFGFREGQSKNIVTVSQCPVLADSLAGLFPEMKTLLEGLSQPKILGHLELVEADNTKVILLRTSAELRAKDSKAVLDFAQQKNLTLYLHEGQNKPKKLCGESPRCDETGFELDFLPTDFIQVNRSVNQQMVSQAIEWLDVNENERVLDLFSGVGNFTFPLSAKAKAVVGIEGVDEMVSRASDNAKTLGIDTAEFYQANLAELTGKEGWASERFDKILLDPARAGAAGVVEKLSSFEASRIVYVSCNPATLARDSESLLEQGYKVVKMRILDMFPHTGHLESMVLFEK